ncbi:succinate dehydrogenase, hydrophobic membrane anchor protein [Candidatus Enterovibrio escicola]|uniref:Succinate dehydrogenase hydrophobic membrane anchor subunit n=1 Tax=Candidatus Enterovibrio escicola TaxID=1927127 RepID=A0A2A5T3P6_9GAMM|nr:succinate dehydrogenase, hydrophobic membrane anchor protein [Candidatus Enterovibrio escacola]PCS22795.1 Succinate dehydrogenase hydrophobic membrane anchor protein [Candidatus Enterovibrio escacola]
MVGSASSFGRNGVHDFILVRATAIIMTFYTIYMVCFFTFGLELTYLTWFQFWSQTSNKVFTMLALVCVLIHAWIGMWQVLTDYIKLTLVRVLMQLAIVTVLFVYLFTGFFILWGV